MDKIKELLKYYFVFLKVGLFTIGGGYTMLPIMEKEIVEKYDWATEEEIIDSYTLAQSIPGIIAVNTSALLGNKLMGLSGAIFSVLGMITPSIIIITLIAIFFMEYQHIEYIASAFRGIRIAVLALLISTVVKMSKKTINDWKGTLLVFLSCIMVLFMEVSPIVIILGVTLGSMGVYLRGKVKK